MYFQFTLLCFFLFSELSCQISHHEHLNSVRGWISLLTFSESECFLFKSLNNCLFLRIETHIQVL